MNVGREELSSSGETTTQALMGRRPHVVRIGENTQGVFSDVLGRRLPNGWTFGLPNEVFRTADGKTFDGPGIPPDVLPQIFEAFVTSRLDARGTGLGLTVAEGIVHQHGGTIVAGNRTGGGARLEVRLPAAVPAC